MTHFYHKLTAVLVALAMVLVLAACGSKTASDAQSGEGAKTEVTEESTPKSTNTDLFTDRDLDPSYENATTMDLSKESASKVTISKAGTYILTGTYNGQVVVNVGDQDKVQLVLDNVTIANNDSAAIYVQAGDKVFVTLKDGTTNKISSSASFSSADADTGDKIDAAIWSKATLTVNGGGKLTVTCDNGHGIVSKDDLKVTGGTLKVGAAKKALTGKDSVRIHDGVLDLTAGDDAIHTSNDEDEDKGFVYIEGGTLTLDSGDDAIHAETDLTIAGRRQRQRQHGGLRRLRPGRRIRRPPERHPHHLRRHHHGQCPGRRPRLQRLHDGVRRHDLRQRPHQRRQRRHRLRQREHHRRHGHRGRLRGHGDELRFGLDPVFHAGLL